MKQNSLLKITAMFGLSKNKKLFISIAALALKYFDSEPLCFNFQNKNIYNTDLQIIRIQIHFHSDFYSLITNLTSNHASLSLGNSGTSLADTIHMDRL